LFLFAKLGEFVQGENSIEISTSVSKSSLAELIAGTATRRDSIIDWQSDYTNFGQKSPTEDNG